MNKENVASIPILFQDLERLVLECPNPRCLKDSNGQIVRTSSSYDESKRLEWLERTYRDEMSRTYFLIETLSPDHVDWARFGMIETIERGLSSRILDLFSANAPKHLQDLEAHTIGREPERAARDAHALRSAASYIGTPRLSVFCQWIEEASKRADLAAVRPILRRLQEELPIIIDRLREAVGKTQP